VIQPQLSNIVPLPQPPTPKSMRRPTLEECQLHAAKIGLSDIEAQKFFHYYESNGFKVGKMPMVSWHGAMAGWKLRCDQKHQEQRQRVQEPSRSVQVIQWQSELKRVEEAAKNVRGAHWFDGRWDNEKWGAEYRRLSQRKAELIKNLGMAV
jgi:hypothetical protein